MNRLSDWLNHATTGWIALACLIIFILFTALVLPAQNAKAEAYSDGIGSPDTSFFYTAEKLYQFAEQYGPEGRLAYIRARLIFDAIFPLVYEAFLTTAISWTYRMANTKNPLWQRLNLLPLMGVIFDYLENASTAVTMARYPGLTPILAGLAGIFTAIKWVFVGGSFVVLIIGVVLAKGFQIRSHKNKRT